MQDLSTAKTHQRHRLPHDKITKTATNVMQDNRMTARKSVVKFWSRRLPQVGTDSMQ
nr:hypothetical protein [Chroococcidiopsis thermalis]